MAWSQTRSGTSEGVQLLALLAIAVAVNIPLWALVMLVTGDDDPERGLVLSLVGILVGCAGLTALRWTRRRKTGSRRR